MVPGGGGIGHGDICMKVTVIGLDGASWPVLQKLLDKGQLPNIARLMSEGASGPLMSLPVSASPIVWTSIASGKQPEKHGVTEFIVDSTALRTKRIWEICEDNGMTVGMFGWLVTYPPKPVNGFLVPGWLATGPETHPEDLSYIKKLELIFKHKMKPAISDLLSTLRALLRGGAGGKVLYRLGCKFGKRLVTGHLSPGDYWKVRSLTMEMNVNLYSRLLREYSPDFSAILITEIDNLSHRYWKYFEPEEFKPGLVSEREKRRFGEVIPTIYRQADEHVGRLLEQITDDTTLVVLSDHGFQALNIPIRIDPAKLLAGTEFEDAFNHWYLGIELHLKPTDEASAEDLLDKAISYMEKARVANPHLPLLEVDKKDGGVVRVRLNHDLFDVGNPKDLVCIVGENEISFPDLMAEDGFFLSGAHAPEGIFVARGPNIKSGVSLDNASVLDITPTLLRLLDLPLDQEMDGKVLEDAITEDHLSSHPLRTVPSYALEPGDSGSLDKEARDDLKDRLKDLGYM